MMKPLTVVEADNEAPTDASPIPAIADAPSAEYMVALTAWEADPSDGTMQWVSETYETVIEVWRIAATEFSAERSQA